MKLSAEVLQNVLARHRAYVRGEPDGERADLRGADLRGVDLEGVDLSGADLRGVDLRGADLRGVDLEEANLRWADLRGVDLEEANLRGVDLEGADLTGADLRGVNLAGATLGGVDLHGARGIVAIGPLGPQADMLYAVQFPDGIRLKTGCFWGTAEELAHAVSERHENFSLGEQYRLAVQLASTVLAI